MPVQKLIITGCARSGTTLLHSLMLCFDNVKIYKFRETLPSKLNKKDLSGISKKYISIKRPQFLKDDERYFTFEELFSQEYKILNIIRDGRDVLVSRHPDNPSRYWVEPPRWINAVTETLDHAENTNLYIQKYEDLVEHPREYLKNIAEFLSVKVKNNILPDNIHLHPEINKYLDSVTIKGAKPVFSHSIGNWEKDINRERINCVMNDYGNEIRYLLNQLKY